MKASIRSKVSKQRCNYEGKKSKSREETREMNKPPTSAVFSTVFFFKVLLEARSSKNVTIIITVLLL